MAMSRSVRDSSDEVREQASDFCGICANHDKLQPASYFCFECGNFGRFLCDTCLKNHNLFVNNHDVIHIGSQSRSRIGLTSQVNELLTKNKKLEEDKTTTAEALKKLTSEKVALEGNFEKLRKYMEKASRDNQRKLDDLIEDNEKEVRSLNNKLSEVIKDRDDLKTKIVDKDKTLHQLDGEVKKLKHDNKMMESRLNKVREEKNEIHIIINDLKGKLERLNYENTGLNSQINELLTKYKKLEEDKTTTAEALKKLTSEKVALEGNFEKLRKYMEKASRDNQRKLDDLIEDNEKEVRSLNNKLSEVIKDRGDLKTRLSKLADADENAGIADLSDPNRAMKVSEKFSQMYDDEWTDANIELEKKIEGGDAIKLLLSILKDCFLFCNNLKEAQIDSLNNVLLHPSHDVTKFTMGCRKNVGGLKERQRIPSKDEKAVRNLRRQIGVSTSCIEEVKQMFVLETKSWEKQGYDKKQLEVCIPYIQKCAEVCWLMVLHDPPLYMKMDASHGNKMDPNLYTVYTTSGDKIDYLVWPPLYNEAGGESISKGVVECFKQNI